MTVTAGQRLFAGLIAAALLGVLGVAAWLEPSPTGFGTHEQLRLRSGIGLQACTWVAVTSFPCPTCGMTTAFAHAANLEFIAAFRAQPLGAFFALFSAVGFWIAAHVASFGSNLGPVISAFLGRAGLWITLTFAAAAWVYKILTWPGL